MCSSNYHNKLFLPPNRDNFPFDNVMYVMRLMANNMIVRMMIMMVVLVNMMLFHRIIISSSWRRNTSVGSGVEARGAGMNRVDWGAGLEGRMFSAGAVAGENSAATSVSAPTNAGPLRLGGGSGTVLQKPQRSD
jgi:hypothetical protein